MLGGGFVIPGVICSHVMNLACEGHLGRKAYQDIFRQRGWRPALTKDASAAQELLPTEMVGVWQKLAVDLVFIEGHSILSVIDYGSRYPPLRLLQSKTSAAIVDKLDDVFATCGLPEVLVSYNVPLFASEQMSSFVTRLGVEHIRSKSRYAQASGMVERLHRVVKETLAVLKLFLPLRKRLNQVLFGLRSLCHRMLGMPASVAMFHCQVPSRLPAHITPSVVNPEYQLRVKADMADHHDSRQDVRVLPLMQLGSSVVIQDGYCDSARPWRVVAQCGCKVGITGGSRYLLRNRQHVRDRVLSNSHPVDRPTLPFFSTTSVRGSAAIWCALFYPYFKRTP